MTNNFLSPRDQVIERFLQDNGWQGAERRPLAGDASFRRYERVLHAAEQAVLMDAPPEKEDVRPFVHVAEHLLAQGFSAPRILARDEKEGLLLLEDLGDDSYSRVLRTSPGREEDLYISATDWLVTLHRNARSAQITIPAYDEALLLKEVSLFADWFLPAIFPQDKAKALGKEYMALWQDILRAYPQQQTHLVHRDYHADNLLWLPLREQHARVGVLDFQDAVLGAASYDLVSILEDARRDVAEKTVQSALSHYLHETKTDEKSFRASYDLLGAQRNSKIVGIFTRLAVRDKKPHYLSFLPRVWGHLERDITQPALAPLAQWLAKHIPADKRGITMVQS